MSVSEFFAMGGYGLYVWGSYGATALLMAVEVIWVLRRRRILERRLARMNTGVNAGMNRVVNEGKYEIKT